MPYKLQRLSLYTQRKLPHRGMLSHPRLGVTSLQSNSYWCLLLSAILTTHGSCKESSWAIKCRASMRRHLCWIEVFGMASLRKWIHKTSSGRRLTRTSIPLLNEWEEVSTTRACRHLLQARNSKEIRSDGVWRSRWSPLQLNSAPQAFFMQPLPFPKWPWAMTICFRCSRIWKG